MMNDPSQMMGRGFKIWPPPPLPPLPPLPADDLINFQTPRPYPAAASAGRMNWKTKKAADKRKKPIGGAAASAGYKPPTLNELQSQNRLKARRFFHAKKKGNRFAPFAPRNTTSFIIRAKKSGGIASLVSPCPVTPAILPTPKFSPSREGLVDMAKEEWGVDGYGSMKGLIRLRSPNGMEIGGGGGGWAGDEEEEVEGDDGSSDSDVEEHLEMERRMDHDLSRFEMVCPAGGDEHPAAVAAYMMENRIDDQDTHIAHLEEENLTMKERMFLMEREVVELRQRLQMLESEFRSSNKNEDNNILIGNRNTDDMISDNETNGNNILIENRNTDDTNKIDVNPNDNSNTDDIVLDDETNNDKTMAVLSDNGTNFGGGKEIDLNAVEVVDNEGGDSSCNKNLAE